MGNSESSAAALADDAAAPQARPKKRTTIMRSLLGTGKVNPEEQRTKIQRKAINGNVLVLGVKGSGKVSAAGVNNNDRATISGSHASQAITHSIHPSLRRHEWPTHQPTE